MEVIQDEEIAPLMLEDLEITNGDFKYSTSGDFSHVKYVNGDEYIGLFKEKKLHRCGFFKFDENGNKFFEHIDPHGIRNPAYENGFIYYNTI